ncbi:MAG: putative porin [Mangrovibacterium sp.]
MKYIFIILLITISGHSLWAQSGVPSFNLPGTENNGPDEENPDDKQKQDEHEDHKNDSIISIMSAWTIDQDGAKFKEAELDTALRDFHLYEPVFANNILPETTGNIGGYYQYADFFKRSYVNDFYFSRNVEAYMKLPSNLQYLNTTTPYSVLTYAQNGNKNSRDEMLFNIDHSQNVNPNFNFRFQLNTDKSTGHYQSQATKLNAMALYTTYRTDKFNSHVAFTSNRQRTEENGGLQPDQGNLNIYDETETFLVNLTNANSEVKNRNFSAVNEYKLGKTEEVDDGNGYVVERFRPITGFLYKVEYSSNLRAFSETSPNYTFFENTYYDSIETADTTYYNRFTNIFQLKFYENPDKKFTFSKRIYIGNDVVTAKMYNMEAGDLAKDRMINSYVGGGIAREDGEFWTWDVSGRLYFTGFKAGQSELSASLEKPLRIKNDTTTLSVEAELNSLVPDYFQDNFTSNHYIWQNRFNNTNEMRIRSKITSQRARMSLGFNYALIDNYIYNNEEATPEQLGGELLILSAYLNKDIVSKHWFVRTQLQWQSSNRSALHLPTFSGLLRVDWKFTLAKVLHNRIGFDVRYNTAYYADAYNPATGQFYLQNEQKIGNYPVTNLHYNFKLKRARFFFQLMNVTSGLLDGNYWAAPNYPLYRRSFRFGVAWSFYD